MKKLKIALWAALLGFIFLIVYQNHPFFLGKQSFGINLLVADYRTPEVYNLALFFICFIAGLLLGSYFVLQDRLKFRKKIKALNANKKSHQAEIDGLQKELQTLRTEASEIDAKTEASEIDAKTEASEIDAKTVVITAESQEPTKAQDRQP
jgi:septal ring factor EnvC (AmiA/AmiB activator)